MSTYVLDSSAILCLLLGEAGAERVAEVLRLAETSPALKSRVLLPFMALMEIEYWLRRSLPLGEVEQSLLLVEHWPVEVRESSPQWRHQAAALKAEVNLSVADAWIASLALLADAELVHKDPEYERVAGLKGIRLPPR